MRTIMVLMAIAVTISLAATAPPLAPNPEVKISGLTLSNIGREKSDVDMTLQNTLLLKLDTLYKGRLAANPNIAGDMKIKLTIVGDGSVSDAKIVTDTTGSKEFPTQVLNTIKALSFDPATQDLDISFTINFSTGASVPEPGDSNGK